MDNFNMKQYLAENKLGAYSRLKEDADTQAEKDMDFLAEYEVIYVVQNGRCYRITDEGYRDEVDMSKCRMYAESKEEKVEEGLDDIKNFFLKVADDIKKGLGSECVVEYNMAIKAGKSNKEAIAIYNACLSGEKGGFQGPSVTKATYGIAEKTEEGYMGTQYDSSEDMAVDMIKKGITEKSTEEALGGKNPEGDALVLRFLQGVAKKFDYPVAKAAIFVKDTIKSLGY